jgi:integrase
MAERIRERTKATGVYKVHARGCPGGKCRCDVAYQAAVYHPRDSKYVRKHFPTQKEAELWRGELRNAVDRGTARAPSKITLAEAAKALLEGMKDGTIESRSGRPYKPSTIRRYELALNLHLLPELRRLKLNDIDRERIKGIVRGWRRAGMAASSVRNNLDPLRVIFREAIEDGNKGVLIDPMVGLKLPQGRGRRERVADRTEAQALIDALPASEQAMWACAFYGTLRRGELRALRWSDVDFDAGVIRVERGWDDKEGSQETKTDAGERSVPLAGILRRTLVARKLASGRGGDDLVFGRTEELPFVSSTVRARALKAWGWRHIRNPEPVGPKMIWAKAREDALDPITLHESRHSAASYLIEAGLNDLELTAMVGHSDSRTTKNIYGHLFPDSGVKVAAKLDAYLDATTASG